jgi:hypothetical protein
MNWKIALTPRRFVKGLTGLVSLALLVSLAFSLNALFASRSQQTRPTAGQPQASAPPLVSPTPTTATDQADPTAGWGSYTSRLGYSIKYPPQWFAAPDPGVGDGDILYERESFLNIRAGEFPSPDNPLRDAYSVIGIQQFTFGNLNMTPTDSIEKVARTIDGEGAIIFQEEPFQITGKRATGLLRIVRIWGQYQVKAYFLHNNKVYVIYSSLPDPQDSYQVTLFKNIASSIEFH